MIFLTPYNIHLVTTFLISTKSGSSTAYSELILIDKTGLIFGLVYQLFLVVLMAVSFCLISKGNAWAAAVVEQQQQQ